MTWHSSQIYLTILNRIITNKLIVDALLTLDNHKLNKLSSLIVFKCVNFPLFRRDNLKFQWRHYYLKQLLTFLRWSILECVLWKINCHYRSKFLIQGTSTCNYATLSHFYENFYDNRKSFKQTFSCSVKNPFKCSNHEMLEIYFYAGLKKPFSFEEYDLEWSKIVCKILATTYYIFIWAWGFEQHLSSVSTAMS